MKNPSKPAVLIILDGWGQREERENNAIALAETPVWDKLWNDYPHTLVQTSGSAVGLPSGQMGNSEVGHLNLGSGRVVYQEFTRVSRSIRTGSFFSNKTLTDPVDQAIENHAAVHILGLLSPGGVHSHEEHIHAMARLAIERGAQRVYLHAFLDGRDTPPQSAEASLRAMQDVFDELGCGQIINICGRYYAMDRDHRWLRVEAAYDLMTQGVADYQANDALSALKMAYERGETDEFVKPTVITENGAAPVFIKDGDAVIFMNYRSDRAREITRPFIEPDFDSFPRKVVRKLGSFTSLTEYNSEFDIPVAFPPERLKNVFGEYIANLGLHQLRLAETEKYAHVTFFFNGGREQPFDGEERILVQSPDVATYDLQPEMSAQEVTVKLVEAIESGSYDAIIVNYANSDMVGHTGKLDAAIKAIETLDKSLGRVLTAIRRAGGEMLITADHGNSELMLDSETGQPHTAHTTNPVPLIYVGRKATLADSAALCDIIPTLLQIMDLPLPGEMSGHQLISFTADEADQ
ncbi:MAG: 2,3-bisphosphoglycerate-independent phosphoglycerate mutase [gamma proteobacterium symbiont of Bathyaustriella thionipta]|nr:2,3-bisphosphoglycerate-independent phosphoglycerate mutase [gamma proteobacterium symbiont of Bathyaustriella thionipta]